MQETYMLKLFYINRDTMVEYHTHEFLLIGNDKDILENVKEQIKIFNDTNKDLGYKVEQYSLYKHIKSESLKVVE